MKAVALSLADPSTWPLRMTIDEVVHVSRRSRRTLFRRMRQGLMFRPDSDGLFQREDVARYLQGGMREFDARRERDQRRERRPRLAVSR